MYLEELEKTSSRIEITKILARLLGEVPADEVSIAVNLLLGQLAPSYRGVVFNLADKMVIRAIAEGFSVSDSEVLREYKHQGDLGKVAQSFSENSNNSGTSISLKEMYASLMNIAEVQGDGSVERKIEGLSNLFKKADAIAAKYIARIVLGKLRLGFSDKTIIDALSWMESGDKSKSKLLESSYQAMPDVGALASEVRENGIEVACEDITPKIGIPVMPMLAQRLKSADEMIKKMGKVAVEPKFDGLRAQIHFQRGGRTLAFTRNMKDISDMFPELGNIGNCLSVDSAILDSEAVGLDAETMKMVDFQTTMNRRRKHQIAQSLKKTPLRFQVFDAIFVDGKSLMGHGYESRRRELSRIISKNEVLVVDDYFITDSPEAIREKHEELLKKGLEGVMVKKLDSGYVPGRTGWRWVKMKEVESANGKLADTVDAVIMGYTRGRGKRSSFGVGQFLAGIVSGESILSITKVGTGMSDIKLAELSQKLKKIEVEGMPKNYRVHKDLYPDFWVRPEVVVELAADELTRSPKHTAGLALRFPRLVRFRDDKDVSQATTLNEIKKLHEIQIR